MHVHVFFVDVCAFFCVCARRGYPQGYSRAAKEVRGGGGSRESAWGFWRVLMLLFCQEFAECGAGGRRDDVGSSHCKG